MHQVEVRLETVAELPVGIEVGVFCLHLIRHIVTFVLVRWEHNVVLKKSLVESLIHLLFFLFNDRTEMRHFLFATLLIDATANAAPNQFVKARESLVERRVGQWMLLRNDGFGLLNLILSQRSLIVLEKVLLSLLVELLIWVVLVRHCVSVNN